MNSRSFFVALLTLPVAISLLSASVAQESVSDSTSNQTANSSDPEAESEQVKLELENLKAEIELSKQREDEISDEIRSLARDRDTLNNDLISSAEKIRELEVSIENTETRIKALKRQEQEAKSVLAERSDVLTHVLAALQRIGKNPPPALVIQPQDALSAVRSAILLNAVIPEIRNEASTISVDLTNLSNLRTSIENSSAKLQTDAIQINEEQVRIETLIELKRLEIASNESDLNEEFLRRLELANKATTIEALIAELADEINSRNKDAQNQNNTDIALADPNRVEPEIEFSQTKGQLPLPVSGFFIMNFGEEDGVGGISEGQYIQANPNALVTSPSDGWVVYAGKFQNYEQLLILNAGYGYHVLLAGMETINVQLGQFVLSGEPVGKMGNTHSAKSLDVAFELENPILYIEFRKDDSPINPDPWWDVITQQKVLR